MWLIAAVLAAMASFVMAVATDSIVAPAIFLGAAILFMIMTWNKPGRHR